MDTEKSVFADDELPRSVEIIGISFRGSSKIYYFNANGFTASQDEHAIVETARGLEYGRVALANTWVKREELVLPLKNVIRIADESDDARFEANKEKEREAFDICSGKIISHGLDMKLIDVEYTFDNSKLLFYFTSDDRVDFRELVKDLASVFRTRIELRQIGIRDEAKLMGGLGICGRPFCCNTFLQDFVQVSIKMAKDQNLSLNSSKISGACGRLMCCLRYEYDTYQEEIRKMPKVDSRVITPDGVGVVTEIKPLENNVKVMLDSDAEKQAKVYHLSMLKPQEKKSDDEKPGDKQIPVSRAENLCRAADGEETSKKSKGHDEKEQSFEPETEKRHSRSRNDNADVHDKRRDADNAMISDDGTESNESRNSQNKAFTDKKSEDAQKAVKRNHDSKRAEHNDHEKKHADRAENSTDMSSGQSTDRAANIKSRQNDTGKNIRTRGGFEHRQKIKYSDDRHTESPDDIFDAAVSAAADSVSRERTDNQSAQSTRRQKSQRRPKYSPDAKRRDIREHGPGKEHVKKAAYHSEHEPGNIRTERAQVSGTQETVSGDLHDRNAQSGRKNAAEQTSTQPRRKYEPIPSNSVRKSARLRQKNKSSSENSSEDTGKKGNAGNKDY